MKSMTRIVFKRCRPHDEYLSVIAWLIYVQLKTITNAKSSPLNLENDLGQLDKSFIDFETWKVLNNHTVPYDYSSHPIASPMVTCWDRNWWMDTYIWIEGEMTCFKKVAFYVIYGKYQISMLSSGCLLICIHNKLLWNKNIKIWLADIYIIEHFPYLCYCAKENGAKKTRHSSTLT